MEGHICDCFIDVILSPQSSQHQKCGICASTSKFVAKGCGVIPSKWGSDTNLIHYSGCVSSIEQPLRRITAHHSFKHFVCGSLSCRMNMRDDPAVLARFQFMLACIPQVPQYQKFQAKYNIASYELWPLPTSENIQIYKLDEEVGVYYITNVLPPIIANAVLEKIFTDNNIDLLQQLRKDTLQFQPHYSAALAPTSATFQHNGVSSDAQRIGSISYDNDPTRYWYCNLQRGISRIVKHVVGSSEDLDFEGKSYILGYLSPPLFLMYLTL